MTISPYFEGYSKPGQLLVHSHYDLFQLGFWESARIISLLLDSIWSPSNPIKHGLKLIKMVGKSSFKPISWGNLGAAPFCRTAAMATSQSLRSSLAAWRRAKPHWRTAARTTSWGRRWARRSWGDHGKYHGYITQKYHSAGDIIGKNWG